MQRYRSFESRSLGSVMRLSAYYLQRIVISRRLRRIGTSVLTFALRHTTASRRPVNKRTAIAQAFHEVGYISLGRPLTQLQCDEILAYLENKSLYDTRGAGTEFRLSTKPAGTKLGDYTLETVVHCPYVMELANCPDFIDLASEYLGFTPTITNLSLRWSFVTDSPAGEVQAFHRDSEIGSFKVLVYLTNVDVTSGPHIYVPRTHHDRMPLRLRLYSDSEIQQGYKTTVVKTGPAGTAFAIDTKGIHKGEPPKTAARLVLGIQYALLPCPLYEYEPVQLRTTLKFDQFTNRLIVRTDKKHEPSTVAVSR
jgi:hypothetical protein